MVLSDVISYQIKDILRKHPQGLNITQITGEAGTNRTTMGRYLENLLVSGHVEMRRFGMEKIYTLSQRVPLSAALSISSELVVQLDAGLRIIFANEPFLGLVGTGSGDLVGKNIEYTPVALVFDESFPVFISNIREGIAGRKWSGEITLGTKDIIVFCRITPTVFDDGRKGVSVILEDITNSKKADKDLRESEDRYRKLVEISPDAVIIHQEGKIIYLNPAACRLLGASHPDMILGRNVFDFIPPSFHNSVRNNIMKDLGGGSTPPMELRMTRIDGTPVTVEGRGVRTFIGGEFAIQVALRDITEQKQAEETLRIKDLQLTSLFSNVPEILFYLSVEKDHRYRFLTVNQSFLDTVHLTEDQVVGRYVHEVIQEPLLSRVSEKYRQAISEKKTIEWEEVQDYPTGKRYGDCHITAIFDENGHPTHIIGSVSESTGHKLVEEALRESEATARVLIDSPTDSVILTDSQGVILALNKTAASRFGRKPDELVGVFAGNLLPQEVAQSRLPLISELLEKKKMVRFEDKRDGRWYDTVAYPVVNETGNVTRIAIIARDITDRKNTEEALSRSERRFRYLISTIGDIVWETDSQARFVYVSPHVEAILGYKPDELIGHTPMEFLHPDAIRPTQEKFKTEIKGPGKSVLHVSPWIHKDGHEVLLESNAIPMFDNNGSFSGFIGIDRKR